VSITTRTGDKGTTALMYGRRVMKCHGRVEAYGTVDELNAALGLARALARPGPLNEKLLSFQKDLVVLMGELSVAAEDMARYLKDGYAIVTSTMALELERQIQELESGEVASKGWAMPGASVLSAALDVARTVCRRAERHVCALQQEGQLRDVEVIIYLNRLSDLLWLLARRAEAGPIAQPPS
jgi:cob(I)alamin adenosyltransferase